MLIDVEMFEEGDEEPWPLQCAAAPRSGEWVRFNNRRYLVHAVEHVARRDWGSAYVRVWVSKGVPDPGSESEGSDAG